MTSCICTRSDTVFLRAFWRFGASGIVAVQAVFDTQGGSKRWSPLIHDKDCQDSSYQVDRRCSISNILVVNEE